MLLLYTFSLTMASPFTQNKRGHCRDVSHTPSGRERGEREIFYRRETSNAQSLPNPLHTGMSDPNPSTACNEAEQVAQKYGLEYKTPGLLQSPSPCRQLMILPEWQNEDKK